jgi:hypothetical protein
MRRIAILTLAFICLMGLATAQQVEFNYNGRVNVMGAPFNGEGQFKLALTNHDGTITYWANDGVTLDGNEPTTAVTLTITDGFFSIDVGDVAMLNMAPVSSTIFNGNGDLYLRAWFNDGSSGFQRLLPDRKVVNPSLLGLFNDDADLVIYVDPVQGDDQFTGLTTDTAKRTIQSAWSIIPPLVRRNVTVQLADGVYREAVKLTGKTAVGEAQIFIIGNTAMPELVRMTGALEGNEALAVKDIAFHVDRQASLQISGICFERYTYANLYIIKSDIVMQNCIVRNAPSWGIYATQNVQLKVSDTEFYGIQNKPLWIYGNSRLAAGKIHVHDCGAAVNITTGSVAEFFQSKFSNMNVAVDSNVGSIVQYNVTLLPRNDFTNCNVGTRVSGNSGVFNAANVCTYTNTPTKVLLDVGDPVSVN